MIVPVSREELDRFRRVIAARLGLQFEEGKLELLADVLKRRLAGLGLTSTTEYLTSLESRTNQREELRELACQLTVAETYFFRCAEQFRALAESVLPERIRFRSAHRRLKILSAGCASGEEPYSLAILLCERFPELAAWDTTILGVDLNPAVLAKAARARYHAWSLRDTPAATREKFFRPEGPSFVLDESARCMVSFEERNLVFDEPPGAVDFDVILCRNMIMYLAPPAVDAVIARLTRMLATGGYLFLGVAETLRGLSQEFDLRHTHDSFYYQKREGAPAPLSPVAAGVTWMDEVRRASDRIGSLSLELQDRAGAIAPAIRERKKSPVRPASVQVGLAFELLRQDRFQEALEVVHRLSPEAVSEPDTQILRAVLLINCGDVTAAEQLCRDLLAGDDLNSGAHYLMALCREHSGDVSAAMEHDRKAIYLDAAFAMPHLHLGRLARRSADMPTARRELEDASSLLVREDTSRILLFGGGFSREALVTFSRAESRACGGPA